MLLFGYCARLVLPVTMVSLILAVACRKPQTLPRDDVAYFKKYLVADMDYGDLVHEFGLPPEDLNADFAAADGLHMYQYPLHDSTFVRIGFTDKIEYACLVDANQNLVEDIIVINHADD